MNKSYRLDGRSEEEFKKDIKSRTLQERQLFLMWLDYLENNTGKRPEFKDNGCGQAGEYLEDKDVSTDPDFEVEGYGQVEVKFANPLLTRDFHLKANQVRSYCESGALILMINGAKEDIPQFTLLKNDTLKDIMDDCKIIPWQGFGGKMSYHIPISKFVWRDLK